MASVTVARADDLPVGSMKMVRAGARRLVLIRTSAGISALDNACPHEGYGLVQGELRDGLLTCEWHNWKFRVDDGTCVLGEESVRSYPVEIVDGDVVVDVTEPDPAVMRPKLYDSLRNGMEHHYTGQIARDVVRLLRAAADPGEMLWEAIAYGAPRGEFGWGHALAVASDCLAMVDGYDGDARALPIVQGITGITESELRRPLRPQPEPARELPADPAGAFRKLIEDERGDEAEALLLGALAEGAGPDEMRTWLVGAVSDHHLAYGHAAIYTQKAFSLLDALGWDRAATVLPHLTPMYVFSTREDKLPYMRPFVRALAAVDLDALAEAPRDPGWRDDGTLRQALLGRDKVAPVAAAVRAVRDGAGVEGLLDEVVLATSERLLRHDTSVDFDTHEDFGWLDITHALTYANAARWAWRAGPGPDTARLALFTAFQAHYTGRAEWTRPDAAATPEPEPVAAGSLRAAVEDRDEASSVGLALGLPRREASAQLERASLADRAGSFIVNAHLIKTAHAAAAEADVTGSSLPLAATARFMAAPRLERFVASNVTRAIDFLSGRGPADRTPS